MIIDSLANIQVKYWASLSQTKNRQRSGQFLVEGDHLVEEAYRSQAIDLILLSADRDNPYPEIKAVVLSERVLKKISQLESQGSIMALCHMQKPSLILGKRLILCDRVQDPGNLGTIIRTATAFGFDGVICSLDCVDFTNEKVIRATQGALFHISLEQKDLLETIHLCHQSGFRVFGTALEDADPLSKIDPFTPLAIVMGNEGSGVSKEILSLCDQKIMVESTAFESLNVAVACGIICHHFRK